MDCTAEAGHCNSRSRTCVACAAPEHCPADQVCDASGTGTCVSPWGREYAVSLAHVRVPATRADGSPWDDDTNPTERLPDIGARFGIGDGGAYTEVCEMDATETGFCGTTTTDLWEGDTMSWEVWDGPSTDSERICSSGGSIPVLPEWFHNAGMVLSNSAGSCELIFTIYRAD